MADKKHIDKLELEIKSLKLQIEEHEKELDVARKAKSSLLKSGVQLYLGRPLSNSLRKLSKEISEKNISHETIGDAGTYILQRFVRVSFVFFLLGLLPSLFMGVQVWIMNQQNIRIDTQNDRLELQNQLIESARRSSSFFLLGNIMEAVNKELSEDKNGDRTLTPELIGQIVSTSTSLMPYRFLIEKDSLSKKYSPERGQLLSFILSSKINSESVAEILQVGDFSYSKLDKLVLSNITLTNLNLYKCSIDNIEIINSKILNIQISGELKDVSIYNSNINSIELLSNDAPSEYHGSLNIVCSMIHNITVNQNIDVTAIANSVIAYAIFNNGMNVLTFLESNKINEIQVRDRIYIIEAIHAEIDLNILNLNVDNDTVRTDYMFADVTNKYTPILDKYYHYEISPANSAKTSILINYFSSSKREYCKYDEYLPLAEKLFEL